MAVHRQNAVRTHLRRRRRTPDHQPLDAANIAAHAEQRRSFAWIKLDTENRPAGHFGKAAADLGVKLDDELIEDSKATSDFIQVTSTNQSDEESANAAVAVSLRAQLEHHPHFRGRSFPIQIELIEGTIVLSGRLPTHYLKQLLQEAIRLMPGVADVDNRVLVMRPNQ